VEKNEKKGYLDYLKSLGLHIISSMRATAFRETPWPRTQCMDINVFMSTCICTTPADSCVLSGFHLGLCYVKFTNCLPHMSF